MYEVVYFFMKQGVDVSRHASTGANLVWMIDDKFSRGIIAADSINYPWVNHTEEY